MYKWRIYYADETTFDNTQGNPEDAPVFGVLFIIYYSDDKRIVMHGWDWYYWNDEAQEFWGIDESGIKDRLMNNLCIRALKQGRTIASPKYKALFRKCIDDPDFPLEGVKGAENAGGTPVWKQGRND